MIKILDCTLRDGGYLNNWNFGFDNMRSLISDLSVSGVDIIECGFLKQDVVYNREYSLFPDIESVLPLLPDSLKTDFALMVNLGEYDLSLINSDKFEIRIAFKPYEVNDLYKKVKPLFDNNVRFSLNPMHISLYSEEDLKELLDISNRLFPVSFTAVDTMGIMGKEDVVRVFSFIDKYLDKNTDIGFHSHNNLNLSLENIEILLDLDLNRNIIIDSCVAGLGRGGGMADTHDIAIYLTDIYGKDCDLSVSESVLNYLLSINSEDKYPYYLSAKNKCHPNYAKYLLDKSCSEIDIDNLLGLIPVDKKPYYSIDIIEELYKKNSLIFEEV